VAVGEGSSTIGLGDVLTRISSRPITFTITVSVVLAIALAVGLIWPPSYSATAVVTVAPITATPFDSTPIGQQVNIVTEREVVMSRRVAERAAAVMGGSPDASELLRAVEVSAPSGSQVMSITHTSGSPDTAARGANAMASAYLEVRAETAEGVAQRLIDSLDVRIDDLASSIAEEDAATPNPNTLEIQQQIGALRDQQARLATVAVNPGQVVSTAVPPQSPSSPGLLVFAVAGLALGVLTAGLLALMVDRLDSKLRSPRRLAVRSKGIPIVVHAGNDGTEAYRRALLMLRQTMSTLPWLAAPADRGAVVLAVVGADERACGHGTATRLHSTALEAGLVCRFVSSDVLGRFAKNWDWPDAATRSEWAGAELVIIDALDVASPARKLALAGQVDLVLIVADPRSSIPVLEDLTSSLLECQAGPSLLFFDRRPEKRTKKSTAWPVDESMYR
jgi:capsular polysaccharide biosynthesis protein